ncbi:hypothetical protein TELCIR_20147, partial [Teladorsagia circumcincta]
VAWIILLSGCALAFVYQAIAVVDKYYRMDKITDIQLKFDTAPFPAITLCNLNPYKDSTIRDEESVKKIANSVCVCEDDECEADAPKVPTESDGMCICAFDRLTQDAWPCHPKAIWQNTTCQFCDDHMFCQKYSKNGERQNEPCLCGNGEAFCMKYDRMAKLLNLWEFFGELSKVTDITDDEIEALGFGNMTDEVAIVTKAKENIIFAMSAVSEQQR